MPVGSTEAQHEAQVVPREVRVGLKMLKCSRRRWSWDNVGYSCRVLEILLDFEAVSIHAEALKRHACAVGRS